MDNFPRMMIRNAAIERQTKNKNLPVSKASETGEIQYQKKYKAVKDIVAITIRNKNKRFLFNNGLCRAVSITFMYHVQFYLFKAA